MKFLWVDLEMTGLDVEKEVVIEFAAVVTDLNFNVIESYHAIVKQDKKFLDGMDEWNTKHHGESGLTASVPTGKEPALVEKDLCGLLDKYFKNERAVIAGNSISQDRLFINKYFKTFASRLHYRMLDVTSWKIMMNAKFNIAYKKKNVHRAVDDVLESIAEMKTYMEHVKPQPDAKRDV